MGILRPESDQVRLPASAKAAAGPPEPRAYANASGGGKPGATYEIDEVRLQPDTTYEPDATGTTKWRRWGSSLTRWRRRPVPPAARVLPAPDAYALWAETYPPRAHNPVMAAEQAIMAPLLASLSPQRALDVGTGTGRNLPLLAAAGAPCIVGADLSMPMLTRGLGGSRAVCADALHLPFRSRAFDVVCSSLMVGDLGDVEAWVCEAARLLAREGHLVYSDFHPAWADSGWRRTFRTSGGEQIELPYFSHSLSQHLAALERAGLEVRTIREPRVAGRQAPVIVLFHAVKP